ncbi:hypothetical protein K443DRAFT_220781 [Laccaria amethystina LaAM-08-1]|uniref:Uncharacterized protein n=1 Tax=Laccaria amethystina LaAM-08-1 TaxID=1095629 RepID=A0A0C9WZ55_9AGAR|nr:hypothetical protein K443DRAFT_220781 [Laccaria amethystina LaAM-08-1]
MSIIHTFTCIFIRTQQRYPCIPRSVDPLAVVLCKIAHCFIFDLAATDVDVKITTCYEEAMDRNYMSSLP